MQILRQYEEDGYLIVEYTKDGVTISHVVETLIPSDDPQPEPVPIEPAETIEDKLARIDATTAYNQLQTEYLVILAEFNAM